MSTQISHPFRVISRSPLSDSLNYHIQQSDESLVIIDLIGNITGEARETMAQVYDLVQEIGTKNVIFNLVECQNMYSPGIAVLLDIIIKTGKTCDQLCLVVPSTHYRKLFHLMGFSPFIVLCDSLEEAHRQILLVN